MCIWYPKIRQRHVNMVFLFVYLWKDDETGQNQRIPAVMLKLMLIPTSSRTGSVPFLPLQAGERCSSSCTSDALWVFRWSWWLLPPASLPTDPNPNRTRPDSERLRWQSPLESALTHRRLCAVCCAPIWWAWHGCTEPEKRGSPADWSQFLFLFGFDCVCVKAAQM